MLSDNVLQLKIVFSTLPMKGLFYWEGLLSLADAEYQKVIEEKFRSGMAAISPNEKEMLAYYEDILNNLKEVRLQIANDPAIRNEVEKIREGLIDEFAHETIIASLRDKLAKNAD